MSLVTHGLFISSGFVPGFVPSDLSGLVWWLDASDASTISTSGSSVTEWADKSSSGVDATPGTAPTFASAAVNGLDAIEFDDASSEYLTYGSLGTLSDISYFIAFQPHDATARDSLVSADGWTTGVAHLVNWDGTFRLGVNSQTPGDLIGSVSLVAGDTMVGGIITDGSSYYIRQNNGSEQSGSITTTSNKVIGSGRIGAWTADGGRYFDGYICEIVLYNRALNSTERGQVQNYLYNKWI